ALFYGGLIIDYRLVPNRRMTAATRTACTPTNGYGIRAVDGLSDMDRVQHVQFDALDNRKHSPKPSVFVEPLGRIAEQQTAFVSANIKNNLVYAVAEALEIGNLFGVVPADG